jgi:hypothetical protein
MEPLDAPMFVKRLSEVWSVVSRRRLVAGGCCRSLVDAALQVADDLPLARSFCGATFDVVAGGLVASHPDDRDDVQGAFGRPVAAAAKSVTSTGAAAAGGLWGDPAEFGEGGLTVDPLGIVTGGDEELAGDLDPDAGQLERLGRGGSDQAVDLLVQRLDLLIEALPTAGQVAQRDPDTPEVTGIRRYTE